MADNNLKIGVSIDGLPKAESDLQQLAKAEESVGAAGTSAGEASAQGHEKAAAKATEHKDAETQVGTAAAESSREQSQAAVEIIKNHAQASQAADDHAGTEKSVGDEAKDAAGKSSEAKEEIIKSHEEGKKRANEHKDAVSPLQGIFNNIKTSATSWVTGLLGLGTVLGFVNQLVVAMERLRTLEDQLSDKTQGVFEKVHSLAQQMGDLSAGGFEKAVGLSSKVAEKAGMNDLGASANLVNALLIAYGDEETMMKNWPEVEDIAGAIGALNLKGEEPGKMIELLKTMRSLQNQERTRSVLGKIKTAQDLSLAQEFGPFASEIIQKGGTGLLIDGMPEDEVLALGVMVREAMPNEARAGTVLENLANLIKGISGSEPIKKRIQGLAYEKVLKENLSIQESEKKLSEIAALEKQSGQEAVDSESTKQLQIQQELRKQKFEKSVKDKEDAFDAEIKELQSQHDALKAKEEALDEKVRAKRKELADKLFKIRKDKNGKDSREEVFSVQESFKAEMNSIEQQLKPIADSEKQIARQIRTKREAAQKELEKMREDEQKRNSDERIIELRRQEKNLQRRAAAKDELKKIDAERRKAFAELSAQQRLGVIEQLFTDSYGDKDLEAALSAELGGAEIGRVRNIFSAPVKAKGQTVRDRLSGVSPESIMTDIGQWQSNWFAQVRGRQAATEAIGTDMPDTQQLLVQMRREAEEVAKVIEASGQAPLSWKFKTAEARMEDVLVDILMARVSKLLGEAMDRGDSDAVRKYLLADRDVQIGWWLNTPGMGIRDSALKKLVSVDRSLLTEPITPEAYRQANQQAQNVTVNNYYGQTGGQTVNLNQKTLDVRNTPGVPRIGQGDSGAASR